MEFLFLENKHKNKITETDRKSQSDETPFISVEITCMSSYLESGVSGQNRVSVDRSIFGWNCLQSGQLAKVA